MASLVIHWGRGTKSEARRTKNNIELGLGGRKKLTKQEIAMCKELHPAVVILASYQVGGIGINKRIMYVTDWTVDYKSKCTFHRDSVLNAGVKTEHLPKDMIPESHYLLLGQLAIQLFELGTSRYKGIRLWGEHHIDSGELIQVVIFENDKEEFKEVYSDPKDAQIAVMLSKAKSNVPDLSIKSIKELPPREAYKIAPSGVGGPTKLIDEARENSEIQRRELFQLLKDIWWGQKAMTQLQELTKIADDYDINNELRKIWREFRSTKIDFPILE